MATIVERPRQNGQPSSWQVQARKKVGNKTHSISQSFLSRVDAEAFATETQRQLDLLAPKKSHSTKPVASVPYKDILLRDALKTFFNSPESTPHFKRTFDTLIRHVGNIRIGELNRAWVRTYIDRLRATQTQRKSVYTFDTINDRLRLISRVVHWQGEQLDQAPARLPFSTKMFPKNWSISRERRLKDAEMRKLLSRLRRVRSPARRDWSCLVRLAIETAARQQELVGALWEEFDLKTGVWVIPAYRTKGKKERTVPLSRRARRVLRLLQAASADEGGTRVFQTLTNKHTVSVMFGRYMESAGIDDFRFHDLRHEAISRMVERKRNLQVYEIMRIVGHSSLAMLNRYANLRFDELVKHME